MTSREFTVYFGPGVADVLHQADQMIKEARAWIGGEECRLAYTQAGARACLPELEARVQGMEHSLLRGLRMMIDLSAGPGGELRVGWDSERSLAFRHPPTGLTGAMIFHPDQVKGYPLPVGNWTLHA